MQTKHLFLFFLLCFATTPILADQQEILQNIRPIGQVNTAAPSSTPSPAAASSAQTPTTASPNNQNSQPAKTQSTEEKGSAIYDKYCVVCHSTGAAGAPKVGDAVAWKPRIAQGDVVLIQHAMQGYKLMPPKGTCISCSQEDITDAVKYMISKSQ